MSVSRIFFQKRHLDLVDLGSGEVQDVTLRRRLVALELLEKRRQGGCDGVDHVHAQRLACGEVRRLSDSLFRPVAVAPVLLGQAAERFRRVVDHLPLEIGRDVSAARRDGRRGAEVRLRRHRQDIGRLADPDSGGGGASSLGRDVDDHRDSRRELFLVDVPHRLGEPAGSVEPDHDRVITLVVRPLDLADHVVSRDRVDVVLEHDFEDTRAIGRT